MFPASVCRLREAVRTGNLTLIQALLASTPDDHILAQLLALASQEGHKGVMQLLLTDKRCMRVVNKAADNGQTAAHLAALGGHESCLKMLIANGADLSRSWEDRTVMDVLFENASCPTGLLQEILDSSVRIIRNNDHNSYVADFSVLMPKDCKRQMDVISSLLVAASDEEKTEVLQHPLIELHLTLNWARLSYFFYLWICIYVVFVLSLSIYVTVLTHEYEGVKGLATTTRYITMVSAVVLGGHAILQCLLTHRRHHFRKYEMWLNLLCTFLSLVMSVATSHSSSIHEMPTWVLHITSTVVLLAWTELMLLIGRHPTYGYYALMFSAVLQNVIRVLCAFLCLVVGFALSFSIQFHNYIEFGDPWRALVKTTVMMMGEFEYGDLFEDESAASTSRVIFLMFIILTSIVLMNLMVGLAVSDIQSLQHESHARKLEKQADFLAQLEKVICSERFTVIGALRRFVKRYFEMSFMTETVYNLSAQPKRGRKVSRRLIDALVALAKNQRTEKTQINIGYEETSM